MFKGKSSGRASANDKTVLKVWQIDSFEGGRGSRADYLQSLGNTFSEKNDCYITVTSLSADAARMNITDGNLPDLISYGAGCYGLENAICGYTVWCCGGYCLLTLDSSADFSDVNFDNTVINEGKDNLCGVAALLCGVSGATFEKSTSAYVSLINGKYKYLLGTQRDIFRLKTRGESFTVKPITEFNDLYQCISVTTQGVRDALSQKFIDYILSQSEELGKIGMLSEKEKLYDDEMKVMEGLKFDYRLVSPISEQTKNTIEKCVSDGDINKLKNLLK